MALTHEEVFERQMELIRFQIEHYIHHDLDTWQWWLMLALTVVPWVYWWFVREKRYQSRLLYGATIVGLIAMVLDMFGTEYGWWRYGVKLIPSIPPLIPYDFTVLPVQYMLIQQAAKTSRWFVVYSVLVAAFNAYVAEWLLDLINVYHVVSWKHSYSFPIYFLIFYLASKVANQESGWDRFYEETKKENL